MSVMRFWPEKGASRSTGGCGLFSDEQKRLRLTVKILPSCNTRCQTRFNSEARCHHHHHPHHIESSNLDHAIYIRNPGHLDISCRSRRTKGCPKAYVSLVGHHISFEETDTRLPTRLPGYIRQRVVAFSDNLLFIGRSQLHLCH